MASSQSSSSKSSHSEQASELHQGLPVKSLLEASGMSEEQLGQSLSSANLDDDSDDIQISRSLSSPIKRQRTPPAEHDSSRVRIPFSLDDAVLPGPSHPVVLETPAGVRRPINGAGEPSANAFEVDSPSQWPVQLACGHTRRKISPSAKIARQLRSIRRRVHHRSSNCAADLLPRRLDFDHIDQPNGLHQSLTDSEAHASDLPKRSASSHDAEASINKVMESFYAAERERFRQRWNFDVVHGPLPGRWVWEPVSE